MLPKQVFLFLFFFLPGAIALAQKATISGFVRDEKGNPVETAVVADEVTGMGGYSNAKGFYFVEIPAGKSVSLVVAQTNYQVLRRTVLLSPGETRTLNFTLTQKQNQLLDETVFAHKTRNETGMISLDPSKSDMIPGTNGFMDIIKTFTGTHDELTSQYSVRGGSFDENLVYVNDFEIYRPFLVRTGQQEGLSFVNEDLVSNVNFSVGGFQAKYGDKMSSVLDVTYKKPTTFKGSVMVSLLGAKLHLEGASKNNKISYLIGARQKSNQYLLQSQPTKGIYNPSFTDIQALVDYNISKQWKLEAIGNYARNRFTFYPESQTTSFGELNQAYQLDVFYNGSEFDQFDTRFAGLSATYQHDSSSPFQLKFLASAFQTNEFETYDITGQYLFGQLQTDMSQSNYGQIKTYLGAGGIEDYARNYLTANVGDIGFKGSYALPGSFILFGGNATVTSINETTHQWENRDSAGFSQPYLPDSLIQAYSYNSSASINYTRFSGFIQDNIHLDSARRWNLNLGVRFNYSLLNSEFITSPRVQASYKPRWKRDVVLKASSGFYAQPPFYREMLNMEGQVNTQIKAQQSFQGVCGLDYNFKIYKRPYKFTFETYYKDLWNIDPYIYNNVQIDYTGKNDAIGYVYGAEARLYGEIVKGATSWVSIGMMKASEKITDSGSIPGYNNYFPSPSDQRLMLGMYIEDYLPRNKNFKVHLNGIYSSGLPVGPPVGHLYNDIFRLPAFKRVDIGFSAILLDAARQDYPVHSFFNNLNSIWASLEIINLLGIQNTLSYSWIQDDSSQKIFGVPNYLSARLLDVKLVFKF